MSGFFRINLSIRNKSHLLSVILSIFVIKVLANIYLGLHTTVTNDVLNKEEAVLINLLEAGKSSRNLNDLEKLKERNKKLVPTSSSKTPKYAYAFVIGGCNPDQPSYRGFLYNILVATRILRELGSTEDVVAFFQLSSSYNGTSEELPDEDTRALQGLNIKVKYIPRSESESFYETVLNKFQILTLTEYRRVLLMDGDVMPISNLDYLFYLSDNGEESILKENVIVSGLTEPSNAGFFMLTPKEGEIERINEIIKYKEERTKELGGYHFDTYNGWGHVIQPPDEWVSRSGRGTNWTFHFAFSDQGLLFHWTKYEKRSVSIIYEHYVENWSAYPNGTARLEETISEPFQKYSKPIIEMPLSCKKFMCDFHHFVGTMKPWLREPKDVNEDNKTTNGTFLWWYYLKLIDKELGLNIDFDNWKTGQKPSLGLFATLNDVTSRIKGSKKTR